MKEVPYSGNLTWIQANTIFLTVHGSRAYGTHRPDSDYDLKGLAIPPREYFLGFLNRFEQAETSAPYDMVIYGLRKFMKLAADANPNIIEVLWTDPEHHWVRTPLADKLLAHRELFLSQKAKHTFSGYAMSQLKRMRSHRRWLMDPPTAPPTREEMGLPPRTVIPKDQLATAQAMIRKQLDRWEFDFTGEDRASRILLQESIAQVLAEIQVTSDVKWRAAGRTVGFDANFLELLDLERQYQSRKKEWDQYRAWEKKRNPDRYELEAKYGYDCYTDDTEFLTFGGWKTFSQIDSRDELATVYMGPEMAHRKFGGVEYQKPIDCFEGTFTGELYHFTGHHTEVTVTPNHRMVARKKERASGKTSAWELQEAANLPDTFEFMRTITPRTKVYSNGDLFRDLPIPEAAFMTLMGWYLSDGSANKDKGRLKGVTISQKKGGRLSWKMARFHGDHGDKISSSLSDWERGPTEWRDSTIVERTLSIRDKAIRNRLVQDCGHTKSKRIPRWVFGLSKRLMERLFEGLVGGDGTVRDTSKRSWIYYTTLKGLADDVQELAFHCGWETSLWGPYAGGRDGECPVYHVHVDQQASPTQTFIRSKNIERLPVECQRIVCFTVPNGTLVTRKNGRVGIHGNSKHAYHLIRLLRMCREILTTGEVIVKRPDAEELLAIRNGAWTADEVIDWAEKEDKALEAVTKNSPLPKSPDRVALDELCRELVCEHLGIAWSPQIEG